MSANSSQKVRSPAKLAHIVLRTSQVTKMSNFYNIFLGGHANYETENLSFITYDEEHHRIAIVGPPGLSEKKHDSAGLDHFAFTFNNLIDLLDAYTARKYMGILPFWSVNHGTCASIYYNDPDGNKIETQVDCFDTSEETTAFMKSDLFAQNPWGVDFDPEEWIQRLDAGEKESVLLKRKEIGARDPPNFG
jgi:catechol-2,3-dioxygenase